MCIRDRSISILVTSGALRPSSTAFRVPGFCIDARQPALARQQYGEVVSLSPLDLGDPDQMFDLPILRGVGARLASEEPTFQAPNTMPGASAKPVSPGEILHVLEHEVYALDRGRLKRKKKRAQVSSDQRRRL